MAFRDPTRFNGITNIQHEWYSQNLLYGLIHFFKWASLGIGGYQNIDHSNASGVLGGDFSRLRLSDNPNYINGQIWEGFRSDWIWETGIAFGPQPTRNSGVFVDGTFYPTATTSGAYAHYVDFPHGRVVFNSAISTTSVVKADFAHRTMSFVRANEPWFRELMFDSYHIERKDFLAAGSGQWDQLAEVRRQLPAVGIELVNRRGFRPYQIGGGQWVDQDVLMYIVAENETDMNQWIDVLSFQNDRTVWLLNRKRMKEDVNYPLDLDYKGSPVSNAMQYPQLVKPTGQGGFAWTNVDMLDTRAETMESVNGWLYRAVVRSTFSIALSNI
jgi:hypothetical protein